LDEFKTNKLEISIKILKKLENLSLTKLSKNIFSVSLVLLKIIAIVITIIKEERLKIKLKLFLVKTPIIKIVNIDKDAKRISLSYKATLDNPWNKIKDQVGKEVKIKINNVTDKAIFGELTDSGLMGMCHYKELSFSENIDELKKYKKNDIMNIKIIEIKDDKIRFSKRALEKDPLDWFKDNKKKIGDIITTRIHEVLKTGVKVAIDKEKKLIITIKKADLAKESADARPEVFSSGNALDAKITELNLERRVIKLSVKAAQIDEEKSLIAKFGEGATKSGATLKGIFEKAIGGKKKKKKEEK